MHETECVIAELGVSATYCSMKFVIYGMFTSAHFKLYSLLCRALFIVLDGFSNLLTYFLSFSCCFVVVKDAANDDNTDDTSLSFSNL